MTHQLIASPYPEGHVVVRPGHDGAVRIGAFRYAELRDAPPGAPVPAWLAGSARAGWGTDLTGHLIRDTVLVRPKTAYGYARASYEVNLGCNYDCEHCYLGDKMFAGLDWPGRERLLQVMADAGVLWLQLTGGEPLIDPLFAETHTAAWDMGMMIMISSNGLPSGHRRVITQAREAAVAPLVGEISPALLWHFDEAGWNVLGYEYADGRHADYAPGSPDLDGLVQLMDALSAIKVPDDSGPFKRAEDRWKFYLDDPEAASVFAGPVLTHSDWTPDNVLVSSDRAWLIDWAWPTLGAGWTDPACWILRLMASGGHTAPEAERQASRLPAFKGADPAHIDLFASANVRLWEEVAQLSTSAWTTKMAQTAQSWATYRQLLNG